MADCKESNEETSRPAYVLKVDPPQDPSVDPSKHPTTVPEKMDSPPSENNTEASASSSNKSPSKPHYPILAASKFGNQFGSNNFTKSFANKRRTSILRPSQLGAVTTSQQPLSKTFLQPAKFQNPFVKATDDPVEEKSIESMHENNKTEELEIDGEKDKEKEKGKDEEEEDKVGKEKDDNVEEEKETKKEEKSLEEAQCRFLPLGAGTKDNESNSVDNAVAASTSEPSFVFGQNLKERVMVANDTEDSMESADDKEKKEESTNENGSAELLFSNAPVACRPTTRPGLTLTQAAQELEEATRANKRKYNEVTPLTGEEGETNVLQINCKLFAFDKASGSWQERGRGTLRLNDRDDEESRLVGRTAGTQRLILNTKVWPGMTAERAAPKSLRLTAMDVHGAIRIFIVQAAPKEIGQLHNLLQQRLKRAQERQPKKVATDH